MKTISWLTLSIAFACIVCVEAAKNAILLDRLPARHFLPYGRELHAMDQVIGMMLIIVLIGLLTGKILFGPIERLLHRRWGKGFR